MPAGSSVPPKTMYGEENIVRLIQSSSDLCVSVKGSKSKNRKIHSFIGNTRFPQLPELSRFFLARCSVSTYLSVLVQINSAFPYL